jgi:hypothetical protein
VHPVVGLEGGADGLGRAPQLPRDPARDLDQADRPLALADGREPARPADDLVALGVGQLPEPRAAIDLVAVRRDEPRQARLEEPDLGPPVDDEPTRHQALAPPARHRPDRDVEPSAHRVDRQDRLGRLIGRLLDGRRQVLHEQAQVVLHVGAVEHQGGRPLGAEARDPVAEVLVRVATPRLDLRQELLGAVDLLEPALARREPGLLLLELLQGWMAIAVPHPSTPPVRARDPHSPRGGVRRRHASTRARAARGPGENNRIPNAPHDAPSSPVPQCSSR